MKLCISFIMIVLLVFGLACSNLDEEKTSKTKIFNPNGDSELSLLMREMFDDAMRMKAQVKKGEVPAVFQKFKTIHTAKATEPEKAASDEFKIFANSYLSTIEALQNAKPDEVSSIYRGMVESCMNCHRAMCPGPMVRIKKLYLSHK